MTWALINKLLIVKKYIIHIALLISCLCFCAINADAQFREEAFTQTYNETDSTAVADTADKLFTFKELFGGLAHKQDLRIGTMFAGSIVLPGISQIYNRDYWKLPIVYGGIGLCAGFGGHYLHQYNMSKKAYEAAFAADPNTPLRIDYRAKRTGTWLMVGAGLVYWGSLMDGVVCYKKNEHPHPGRATVYSILLPGLGQAYNGEYWKIPIYWGCLAGSVHFLCTNNTNYHRFKRIHNEASQPGYTGPITAETAVWYRNVYRRYRDYSIVATALFYLLQVIDANVFAYMHDFEVTNDISMNFEPTVITPANNAYALNSYNPSLGGENAVGLKIGLRF